MPPVDVPASLRSIVGRTRLSKRILNDALEAIIRPVRVHFDEVIYQLDSILSADVPTVDAVSRYVAATKGKCLRPALVLLAAEACGAVTHQVRLAAVSMELLQASTLLHDDVIDQSVIRRGAPSVNARWDNQTAVLMGDILFMHALSTMLETASLPVMKIAAAQTRRMIEGEVHARDQRRAPDFTEKSYLDLINRKTASLMSLATEAGARLSDGNDEQIHSLTRYGDDLGMAFQIVDDVLDVIGDPNVIGKPTGQDFREGTVTLPLIRALQAAPASRADAIRAMVIADVPFDTAWKTVFAFIKEFGGIASSLDTASEFARRAGSYLDSLPLSPARDSLDRMVGYVINREM